MLGLMVVLSLSQLNQLVEFSLGGHIILYSTNRILSILIYCHEEEIGNAVGWLSYVYIYIYIYILVPMEGI